MSFTKEDFEAVDDDFVSADNAERGDHAETTRSASSEEETVALPTITDLASYAADYIHDNDKVAAYRRGGGGSSSP